MKIKRINYYGFDHKEVNKKFKGDLEYIGDICIKGEYKPVAVYHANNPNLKLGHKEFMLLQPRLVRGMTRTEFSKESIQHAVKCLSCNMVLYSVNRHDMTSCECENETFVDGGKDYLRIGGTNSNKIKIVTLDLLNKTIKYKK